MTVLIAAPQPSYRLIPSKYPPVGLFDTVATIADAQAVMELAGWTNDRLVVQRVARLPRQEWVFGRANSSVVMAAFLHAAPGGGRFNGPDLGAWYAAAEVATAVAEVGHHLRREAVARHAASISRTFRTYRARLDGHYVDVGRHEDNEVLAPDSYGAGQAFGEAMRAAGRDGLVYPSVRRTAGTNVVAYRPSKVTEVVQADHCRITVAAESRRIEVQSLP